MPAGLVAAQGVRPTRSTAVRSSWQATVTSVRSRRQLMCSTKRVLPQPVGPLSITGRRCVVGRLEELHLVAQGQVVGLLGEAEVLDALALDGHCAAPCTGCASKAIRQSVPTPSRRRPQAGSGLGRVLAPGPSGQVGGRSISKLAVGLGVVGVPGLEVGDREADHLLAARLDPHQEPALGVVDGHGRDRRPVGAVVGVRGGVVVGAPTRRRSASRSPRRTRGARRGAVRGGG